MVQNRDAPAFQEYAAATMARVEYRTMSLAARGLLYTMRLECWVNRGVPADAAVLAKILGFSCGEIAAALPEVMPFFAVADGRLVSPELDNYRAHLDAIRAAQSKGGKLGAARAGRGRGSDDKAAQNQPASQQVPPQVTRKVTHESLDQHSPVKASKTQSSRNGRSHENQEWVSDYEKHSAGH